MVNKYLRMHQIFNIKSGKSGFHKPIFPVSPRGKKLDTILIDITPKILKIKPTVKYDILELKEDPLKDLTSFSSKIYKIKQGEGIPEIYKKSQYKYTDIGKVIVKRKITLLFIAFMHSFKDKWGTNITIYMMKYYMPDYLNYRRW